MKIAKPLFLFFAIAGGLFLSACSRTDSSGNDQAKAAPDASTNSASVQEVTPVPPPAPMKQELGEPPRMPPPAPPADKK
jgi:hypothetical protein